MNKNSSEKLKEENDQLKVVFTPSGRQGHVPVGTTVLAAGRLLGVDIDSVCGGRAMCGRCQVNVGDGEFSKHGIQADVSSLNSLTEVEERYVSKRGLQDGRRLSCQAKLFKDSVIDVPPESQVHNQIVRKDVDNRKIRMDPVVRLCFLEVREPALDCPSSDLDRLIEALVSQWPDRVKKEIKFDYNVLKDLQNLLRKGNWKVTVALRKCQEIIAIWPGLKETIFGIAIDVGSTTLSAHLCDFVSGEVLASSGSMNPQIRFGEDLMSRVSYGIMNPGGVNALTKALTQGLQKLIDDTVREVNLERSDVVEIVLVGNPVMHHLLLGIDPVELGGAPFALAVDDAVELTSRQLGLAINSGGWAYILPCIAGHVGADAAAVVLAEAPQSSDEMCLIIDVGTNAEIIIGNSESIYAASSPTGPAFEGAQISSGQRAAPGAIERVRIDRKTLEPRFRVIGSDIWSDETSFSEVFQKDGVSGICGSGIIEAIAEMYLSGIITEEGVIDGRKSSVNSRIELDGRTFKYRITGTVFVTQNDVRAIQLAKAALYAGSRLLMDKIKIESVDKIVLAGAFGTHIDPKYAMVIGMIPDCLLENVQAAGNAAGTGARIALLNKSARKEIETVVKSIKKIETAVEPNFQDYFVDAMAFPHKNDKYPNLANVVDLPSKNQIEGGKNSRQGRRRMRRRG